ncbi:MAG: MFS transporter [Actinomycetota bacterium]
MTLRRRFARAVHLSGAEWAAVRPLLLVGYFETYDSSLLSIGASTISVGLGVTASAFAIATAVVRFIGLGSIPVARLADRIGRKRLLVVSMIGFTLATGLTAVSWGLYVFVVFSAAVRVFVGTETAVATVVISEQVRTERRGSALAVLGALSGLGAGTLAFLLPLADESRLGWRVLYVWPLVLMPLVIWLRRSLHETGAFQEAESSDRLQRSYWPTIAPEYRPWMLRLALIQFVYGAVETSALFYASHVATIDYDWLLTYSAVLILGAPFGILGFVVGGQFSDRWGRRPAIAASLIALGVGVIIIFPLGTQATFAPGYWLIVFANAAIWPAAGAYMAELFATEVRATFQSFLVSFQVLGSSIGLLVVGLVASRRDVDELMVVAAVAAIVGALLLRAMPETAGRHRDRIII